MALNAGSSLDRTDCKERFFRDQRPKPQLQMSVAEPGHIQLAPDERFPYSMKSEMHNCEASESAVHGHGRGYSKRAINRQRITACGGEHAIKGSQASNNGVMLPPLHGRFDGGRSCRMTRSVRPETKHPFCRRGVGPGGRCACPMQACLSMMRRDLVGLSYWCHGRSWVPVPLSDGGCMTG